MMERARVAVRGIGMISPLDRIGLTTWDAIVAGNVPEGEQLVCDELLPGEAFVGDDRMFRLGRVAASRALSDAGGDAATTQRAALFAGTSKGGVESIFAAADWCAGSRYRELPPLLGGVIAAGPSGLAASVAERLRICGTQHTTVAACSSGMIALHRAVRAIQYRETDRAVVVAADASVHPLFEASFDRLGVLAKRDADGVFHCRPGEGSGMFIAEGAAAIVLERVADSDRDALLADTWIGGQAVDLVGSDPAGETLRVGLSAMTSGPLAFAQAHAPGTSHDVYEFDALRQLPGAPATFSHKRWTGHTLGAAGLIAAVLSVESHRRGVTPIGTPVPRGSASITVAQGFGGHVAILRLNDGAQSQTRRDFNGQSARELLRSIDPRTCGFR
jgi:3-oxoacyl-[acyl-carrier-protein] synthase II